MVQPVRLALQKCALPDGLWLSVWIGRVDDSEKVGFSVSYTVCAQCFVVWRSPFCWRRGLRCPHARLPNGDRTRCAGHGSTITRCVPPECFWSKTTISRISQHRSVIIAGCTTKIPVTNTPAWGRFPHEPARTAIPCPRGTNPSSTKCSFRPEFRSTATNYGPTSCRNQSTFQPRHTRTRIRPSAFLRAVLRRQKVLDLRFHLRRIPSNYLERSHPMMRATRSSQRSLHDCLRSTFPLHPSLRPSTTIRLL
jgi:hypothetical protein